MGPFSSQAKILRNADCLIPHGVLQTEVVIPAGYLPVTFGDVDEFKLQEDVQKPADTNQRLFRRKPEP